MDDANDPARIPANPFPSFQHHSFPRTLVHEMQGPTSNAEYGKYDFIDVHGSGFDRMETIQSSFSPDTMLLRHISARAYQNFGSNYCRISSGVAFETSGPVSQGGPETAGCSIYAGHFLYKAGTRTSHSITAQATSVTVADASKIKVGQYVVIYDAPVGSFNNAEHARVSGVNTSNNSITFNKRGFKSVARARAAGAIVATHVLGQGPEEELWAFNTSTQCPTDANGRTFNSFYANWLAKNYDRFAAGTRTSAKVAGLLFDADMYFELASANADYNNDLVVDHGISNSGVNWQGVGLDQFYQKVRAQLPNIHILSGLHDARGYAWNNGVQLENWLDFGNGDFRPNPKYTQINSMFSIYLFNMQERDQKPPLVHNLTKTPTRMYSNNTDANSNAPARLALAMTLMDDGYFGTHANVSGDAWWDEFAVDVDSNSSNFGRAVSKSNLTGIKTHKGWLGDPLGKFRRVYDEAAFAPSKSLLTNGSFEGGVNGWSGSNVSVSPSSNAYEGSGAMHVSEMQTYRTSVPDASVRSTQISLTSGREYTVSFMARSSEHRELRVVLGSLNDKIPVGPNWRRYVLSFRQDSNQNTALNFQVGRENTRVWLDSMFVFQGSANVLRRDFENGIVVANATPTSKTVDLGATFQKIRGNQDPNINNGATVNRVTLPPYDALLLVRPDGDTAPPPSSPPPPSNTGEIGDLVWQDDNKNGIQDFGEDGLGSVKVDLLNCNNEFIKSTTSTSSGRYIFSDLAIGDYVVRFNAPNDMSLSPADRGTDRSLDSNPNPDTGRTDCLSMADGQTRYGIDAGLYVNTVPSPSPTPEDDPEPTPTTAKASFGDLVWLDTNGNGIQNSSEPGFPGAKVKLLTCDGKFIQQTFSNDNGIYRFKNLEAGQYRLEFPAPTGMKLTRNYQGDDPSRDSNPSPSSGRTQCLSLTSEQYRSGIDVGMMAQAPAGSSDDDSGSGETGGNKETEAGPKEFGSGGGGAGLWLLVLGGLLGWRQRG